jgi:hypothetical protein
MYPGVFRNATGTDLHPGTINVSVETPIPVREDFRIRGTAIGEPQQDLIFERCRINGRDAFRIRPFQLPTGGGGHGDDILEITCSAEIPDLVAGTQVEVEFFRDAGEP